MLIFLLSQVFSFSLPDFYHTTDEILSEVQSLACPSLQILDNETVHAVKFGNSASFKVFLLFGEHPRELITVELALKFIESICDSEPKNFQAIIVFNANPRGRQLVEQGQECRRTNDRGVDLNRNWDSHWLFTDCFMSPDTCSGPFPFSEPETLRISGLFESFKPDLFISVHSGISALMYPPAYTFPSLTQDTSIEQLLSNLKSSSNLDVEIGITSKILSYTSSGNCLDFSFEHNTTSLVFEIFKHSPPDLSKVPSQKTIPSSDCFSFFNPSTLSSFSKTLTKWSSALLSTINLVCS
jgi:hypothetical protein